MNTEQPISDDIMLPLHQILGSLRLLQYLSASSKYKDDVCPQSLSAYLAVLGDQLERVMGK